MKKLIRFVLNNVPRRHIQRVAHFAMPLVSLGYVGRGVECPVCGAKYRRFLPYGYAESRKNALCPRCLALERHRLLWMYLLAETDFFDNYRSKKMLHIAPERCYMKYFELLLGENYITADLESPLAKVKMDIHEIPFDAESFDVIFCNHILEHVEDDRLAMSEVYRVMRQGGWGIMLSPVTAGKAATYEDSSITTPEGRLEAFGQRDHLREYGEDYVDRLAEAGFEVEAIDYISQLPKSIVEKYGLRSEIIYLVKKTLKE